MKDQMKKRYLLLIILILLIFWTFLIYNFFLLKSEPQKKETALPTAGFQPTMTDIDEAIEKIRQEGGTIPFDYQVIALEENKAILKGLKGELRISNLPEIKFFLKINGRIRTASFSDLKVGQKLLIEKASPPSLEYKVFIVGD